MQSGESNLFENGTGKPSVLGFRSFIVMTGSMEPTIHARSLVLAVPVSPDEVREGDVVTCIIQSIRRRER